MCFYIFKENLPKINIFFFVITRAIYVHYGKIRNIKLETESINLIISSSSNNPIINILVFVFFYLPHFHYCKRGAFMPASLACFLPFTALVGSDLFQDLLSSQYISAQKTEAVSFLLTWSLEVQAWTESKSCRTEYLSLNPSTTIFASYMTSLSFPI